MSEVPGHAPPVSNPPHGNQFLRLGTNRTWVRHTVDYGPFHQKSSCLHAINFRALCGANLVAKVLAVLPAAVAPRQSVPRLIQGYLAHKKHPPRTLGIGLL